MQATVQPQNNQITNTTLLTHDPVLSPEDEAFFQHVMSRSDTGGAESVTVDEGPVARDAQNPQAEAFGKDLGEEQRRTTTGVERGDDDKGGSGEAESETEKKEKKKKRWSFWPWKKEKVGFLFFFLLLCLMRISDLF